MVKMPHWPNLLGHPETDENLPRMKAILASIGNPQNHLPKIIHIAGTNGKGSVQAFIRSILTESGFKVHSYSSPHINNFNERINLCGTNIDDRFLYEVIESVRINLPNNLKPTFFEATTAAAILAFSKIPADFLLVECGMGARMDATNIFNKIELAIITSISLDHAEFLGENTGYIAAEKAFIMKPNCKTVIAAQDIVATEVLKLHASKINSPIFYYEKDYDFFKNEDQLVYVDIAEKTMNYYPLPALAGKHQLDNAATAIAAIKNLVNFNISDSSICQGLTKANLPGRLENVKSGKLVDVVDKNSELWIDGAHNISGAKSLSDWLAENQDDKLNILIIGKSAGRDQESFIAEFKEIANKIFVIEVEGEPKPEKAQSLLKIAENIGINCEIASDLKDAIEKTQSISKEKRILICGSLYLQNDLKKYN